MRRGRSINKQDEPAGKRHNKRMDRGRKSGSARCARSRQLAARLSLTSCCRTKPDLYYHWGGANYDDFLFNSSGRFYRIHFDLSD